MSRSTVLRCAATVEHPAGMSVLIAARAFANGLGAQAVALALARGLERRGLVEPQLLELPPPTARGDALGELLARERFDARAHAARAVVVAVPDLHERSLADSPLFELATRTRQAGVPTYAVAARSSLDSFDARILDLQLVLEATSARSLSAAGVKLPALSARTRR